MQVLVTGGSGFLGSYVVEQLTAEGHDVRALVRPRSDKRFLETLSRIRFADGSIEDTASLESAVDGVDAIIHVAGLVKARRTKDFYSINTQGTRNLLEAAAKRAHALKRFVYVSSLAAVGPSVDGKLLPDEAEPHPVSHYGRSKLEGERVALAAKDRTLVTVIRPPLLYGPRDRETLAFFTSIRNGVLPVLGDGSNTLSVVTGADCARACVRALTAAVPSGRTYFLDDGRIYVWRDALAEIEKVLGRRAWLRIGLPLPVVWLAAAATQVYGRASGTAQMLTLDKMRELKQRHWVCSGERARRELSWGAQTLWPEGVAQAARWYRAQGWL